MANGGVGVVGKRLVPSRTGNLGILLLNNPKALHALTGDMVDAIDASLREWSSSSSSKDPTTDVRAILIKSSSSQLKRPSFCAGGDVKSVYLRGLERRKLQQLPPLQQQLPTHQSDYFRREYRVNHAIATSRIPIVSLWDGLVIGGGVGLSIHGRFRVATERARFSMPECRIGLFPDVGSTWWMPRLLDDDDDYREGDDSGCAVSMSNYLALTGRSLEPADLLRSGLATHYVPSGKLADLEEALAAAVAKPASVSSPRKNDVDDEVEIVANVLASFHEPIPTEDCHLARDGESIRRAFRRRRGDGGVEGIVRDLERTDTDFARSALAALRSASPTSLKVTLEGLERGRSSTSSSLAEALAMEFRMVSRCVRHPGYRSDFYEGVKSVLVDRTHVPVWDPPTLGEVTDEIVDSFFAPVGNDDDEGGDWTLLPVDGDDADAEEEEETPSRL